MPLDIERELEHLKRKLKSWRSEYKHDGPKGTGKSGMRKADIVFLERQIAKLEKAKDRLVTVWSAVNYAVREHEENW